MTENCTAARFLIVLRELHRMGYADLRFYSYRRWIGTLAVTICRELPLRASSGEAFYTRMSTFEVNSDLRFRYSSETWGLDGISDHEAARLFAQDLLRGADLGYGVFDRDYSEWLDLAIHLCPIGRLPITGEPWEAKFDQSSQLTLYPSPFSKRELESAQDKIALPVPPGLTGAIDPLREYRSAMDARAREEQNQREKERFRKLTSIERKTRRE